MTVIFLINAPFIKQLDIDLMIDVISKQYEIKKISLEKIYKREFNLLDSIDYITVNNFQDLRGRFDEIRDRVVVVSNVILDNKDLLEVLDTKKVLKTIYIQKGDLIENMLFNKNSLISKIKKNIKNILNKANYDYVFKVAHTIPSTTGKNYLNIHSIKYDEYLNEKETTPILDYKYVVFLDQYVPYHPDIIHYWKQESVEPNKYFQNLNNFFDLVEKKYNLKVVISAHPKADYDEHTFNGREIIKYKTPNLIKYSEFVMLHSTTSVANVVLANKPSMFLYYQEMLEKGSKPWTIAAINLAKELNAPLIDLDTITNETINLTHDEKAYENFKYKYLVNKKLEHKSNEQIVLEFLKTLENVGK